MSNITAIGDYHVSKIWAENFDSQQATISKLPPYPQNHMLFFVSTLCSSNNIPIKLPPNNNIHCPQKPIVTVQQ